jgi:hypothetical protein
MRAYGTATAIFLLLATGLGGCAQIEPVAASSRPVEGEEAAPALTQFTDLPIPSDSTMNLEDTLILGSQESWLGRLALRTAHDAGKVNEFYRNEMPKFGWTEITIVRSEISIHTWSRGDRIATIRIEKETLRNTDVEITISPRSSGASGSF